jgi:RHS repeat-associated protein
MSWKSSLTPWARFRSERPRPKRPKVRPEILRLETRWLLSTGPGITEYAAASSTAQPVSTVAGSDGNLWVTEYAAKKVVAFSSTGAIVKTVTVSGMPYGIAAASDGTLWVTENGTTPYIAQLSTSGTGSVLAQYPLPSGTNPQGITAGPNGNMWFVGYGTSVVDQITPSGSITTYSLSAGSRPVRITTGSDGNLWVTESLGDKIARVTIGGSITEFAVPTKSAMPWGITAGPDGNLWFTENGSNKIGRITTSGVITEFSLGQAGLCPFDIAVGCDGNLWFTENTASALGRITTSGIITQYTLPTSKSGPEGITMGPGCCSIWWTETSVGQVGDLPWMAKSGAVTTDPNKTQYNPFATGQIGLLDGNQQTPIPLDPAPACSTCCCGGGLDYGAFLGMGLSLTDNSDTVDPQPIIDTTYCTDPNSPVPTSIQVTLTWNGTPQTPVTFQTTGHSPGDMYQLNVQVANPVTTTGAYPWSVDIQANLPNGNVVESTISGAADVVANGPSDPIGTGWSIGGTAQLVSDGHGGYFWVDGGGGTEDFQAGNGTTFVSPPQDQGTLVKNSNGSFTYTNPQQEQWDFNSQGQLTSIVQPDGPSETLTYSGSDLTTITQPGSWTSTFTYSGGELSQIQMPGGRDVTLTHTGSDLTDVTMPDGSLRTFTYDSAGRLINDSWGTRSTTYTYDMEGALSSANEGLGRILGLIPSSIQGLQTNPAIDASQDVAVWTNPLGRVTTYTLNSLGEPTKILTPDGGTQTYQYDFAGQPTVYTDELGRVTTYTYQYGSGDGELTQEIAPDGGTTEYQYNATFHEVTQETDPLGRVTTYLYNSVGDLTETIDPLGRITTEVWSNGLLQSETTPLGYTTTYQYNSQREEIDQIDPLGRITTYTYDAAGNQITVEDPMGRVTTYVYDAMRRVIETIDPLGRITTTLYDANGDVTETIDPLGRITTTLYDVDGEVTETIDALGRITTTLYDADGEVTESIDPMGRITTSVYDLMGRVTESIDPMNRITTTTYDLDGEVTESIDPMSRITTTLYDELGRVTETIDPMGRITTTLYDLDSEVTESIDPMGRIITAVYDADGEVTETVDPLGHITTTLYDADGEVTGTIDALGNRTTTLYDADGEVTETIDPLGHITTKLYDADGEVTETIDPLGRITTTVYDADGEVTETLDPLGRITTTLYDADGEVIETIDPMGNMTTTLYDADGEVTESIDPMGDTTTTLYDADGEVAEVIDPRGYGTTTIYDADGEVTEIIDPDNNATTTLYDADGEVTETINSLGNMTTTLYDADGEVTETIDADGRITTSLYDADGRLVGQTWYDSHGNVTNLLTYTYDADGNMLTAQDFAGTDTMTYDALNRIITFEDPFGLTLTYTYDADGNRTLTQDSLGGVTSYVYDADNELINEQFGGTGQTPLAIAMTDDADGELLTETRYSNLAETDVVVESYYTYNADGEITNLLDINGGGTIVANFTYTYDRDNRVVTEDNLGLTTTYTYDADSELTSETSSLATIDYMYDPNGNRIGGNNVIGPDNQLLSDTDWDYSYDADGNLIQKVGVASGPDHGITWTYTYNNKNQMTTAVDVQNGTTLASVTYVYDALGNRIEEDVTGSNLPSQVTRFAYDGQNVWADLDGSNNLLVRRIFLNTVDSVTARISASGTVAWYLPDRLGSINVITDATGDVIDRITYDGYGNILSETNPSASDRYLFTGREFDRVTGLEYNRARYYDPTTGRWTTEDPLGLAVGPNPYVYVGNNPTNAMDPSGMCGTVQQPAQQNGAVSGRVIAIGLWVENNQKGAKAKFDYYALYPPVPPKGIWDGKAFADKNVQITAYFEIKVDATAPKQNNGYTFIYDIFDEWKERHPGSGLDKMVLNPGDSKEVNVSTNKYAIRKGIHIVEAEVKQAGRQLDKRVTRLDV